MQAVRLFDYRTQDIEHGFSQRLTDESNYDHLSQKNGAAGFDSGVLLPL